MSPHRRSQTELSEREIRGHVVASRRGLHKTQRLHDAHRHEPEIKFGWIVARAEKVRIVVMVVLKAGAESRHDRQPVTDVHCIVLRVIVALSLIHISEPTRLLSISYAVFCL